MLQQVMTSPGKIEFREVPVPKAKKGQLVIKIMKIGICGSDIHVYHGKHRIGIQVHKRLFIVMCNVV